MHELKRTKERERLEKLVPLPSEPQINKYSGVLYSDLIIHLCENVPDESRMISPFSRDHLHPAGYKLTVGDEFYLGKEYYTLADDGPEERKRSEVKIPPFEVAILKTRETLCIPRFLIARWNIIVKEAYKGLLWVGGPQVDPGWRGHLFCPIYNLSSKPVLLQLGDDIALMDFVTTTPFPYISKLEDSASRKWEVYKLHKSILIEDYGGELVSALFTEAAERLDKVEGKTESNENRLLWFITIVVAALAAIPALLGSVLLNQSILTTSIWGPAALFMSGFSFLIVVLMMVFGPFKEWRINYGNVWTVVLVSSVLLAGGVLFITSLGETRNASEKLISAIRAAGIERISTLVQQLQSEQGGDIARDLVDTDQKIDDLNGRLDEIKKQLEGIQEGVD